jgi:hypothetical protein
MAALVLKMSVSLDGFVAPIDGSTDRIAAGGSDDTLSWTVETVSNAGAPHVGPPETWPKASHGSSRSAPADTCWPTAGHGLPGRWSRPA